MKKFSIVSILLGALLAFALAGCSDDNGAASQAVDEGMIEGSWVIDEGSTFGIEGSLVFGDDGSVELVVGGESYVGAWSVSDGNATVTMEGQDAVTVSLSDDKLTVGNAGASQLVFVRGEVESQADEDDATTGEGAGEATRSDAQASADAEDAEDDEGDANSDPELVDEVITDITPVVIADDANCTITVTGRGTDYTADPCYRIDFTNKTGSPLYITAEDDFDVNGKTVIAGIDDIADPGETITTEIYFPVEDLGGGLEQLVNVNGILNVQIDETYETVADYPFHMD